MRERNESAWLIPADQRRVNQALRDSMRRYDETEEVDLVVVGCGAGGSTLMQRMARHGWKIVGFDAGPFWDPEKDWVSDEAGSHTLYWTDPRTIGGADPVPLGSNNSGRGVGGSMVHYAGYTPRFHPSDFATAHATTASVPTGPSSTTTSTRTTSSSSRSCRSPARTGRGDARTPTRRPRIPVGGNGELLQRGAAALGIETRVGPVAISNGRFGNRPHCIYRGFCLQGCKVNAKASPLITHLPDALAHGVEIRPDTMVTRIGFDERTGRATGVHFIRESDGVERFQPARMVAVAGYSIETPRLLLNSATSQRFPNGMLNDHDLVGRYLMVQGAPQTAARFDAEVRMYKAPPPEVSTEAFYETDPTKPYKRGFSIQTVSPLPITWAEHVVCAGRLGSRPAGEDERLRALGDPRRTLRAPPPGRQPGHTLATRRTGSGFRSRTSTTPSATTTSS